MMKSTFSLFTFSSDDLPLTPTTWSLCVVFLANTPMWRGRRWGHVRWVVRIVGIGIEVSEEDNAEAKGRSFSKLSWESLPFPSIRGWGGFSACVCDADHEVGYLSSFIFLCRTESWNGHGSGVLLGNFQGAVFQLSQELTWYPMASSWLRK